MRRTSSIGDHAHKRLSIAVVADGSTGFGRSIVRGAMQYINRDRRWMVHTELDQTRPPRSTTADFDGAIVGGVGKKSVDHILRRCRHVVFCSGSLNPDQYLVASLDDYVVGKMAADHLLDRHLQRFAFYGLSDMRTSANRYRGFKETVERRGHLCLEVGFGWVKPGTITETTLLGKLADWLRNVEKPIGIMAVDDGAANELASVCIEADVDVPSEIAIIGVNNDDLLCETAWPPLSSVDGGYNRVGYAAAAMLDQVLHGNAPRGAARATRLMPLRIVARQSTDMLAIDDDEVLHAVRFIREHACDPCTVEDVLGHVPMNRRRMERRFKEVTGHGPHEEIIRVRMETAKKLLMRPEMKLETIARECGIPSIQHFRRVFLKTTGLTPTSYRRKCYLTVGPVG